MSSAPNGLREGKSQPATIFNRLQGLVGTATILTTLYLYGLPHAIWTQFTQPNPLQWLNPIRWRNLVVEAGLPKLLIQGDIDSGHLKRLAITEFAKGKVLELGAGTGLSLQYYDQGKVTEVYLVEPFAKLHPQLKHSITKMGQEFASKATIIPYGVENRENLKVYGIEPASFDTIVLGESLPSLRRLNQCSSPSIPPSPTVQVLCSIPNREDHLPYLQSLLKPGGQLLLFEHVASDDRFTELLQKVYNPFWTVLSMGCNVNRHSGNMVKNLGGWKEVQMRVPEGQHSGSLYPRVIGRYVKA